MNLAQTLIADPTFSLMSREERLDEARAIGVTAGMDDDPLDFALAVEEAEALLAAGFSAVQSQEVLSAGIEPCREDRASCASPVAGNGRCLECGARRASETPPALVVVDGEIFPAEIYARGATAEMAAAREIPGIKSMSAPILSRFKAVTGTNDTAIGDLLNMARSTVQASGSGRSPEKLTPKQLLKLSLALTDQAKQLEILRTELEDRISV